MTQPTDPDVAGPIGIESVETRARDTYRYLRIIVVLPAAWLLLTIVVASLWQWRLNDSISDYYGGPLRDVFVGGLMACGVCMIAYKGQSKLEDYALNFAGANTFFVALVPNTFQELLDEARASEKEGVDLIVPSAEFLGSMRISVILLLVLMGILVAVDRWLFKWTPFQRPEQTRWANRLIGLSMFAELLLFSMVVRMLIGSERWLGASIFTIVHFAAAAILVLNLSIAASNHGFEGLHKVDKPAGAGATYFKVISTLMWVGIPVALLLWGLDVPYVVLGIEFYEIILFLCYWVGATRSEWRRPEVRANLPDAA